MSSGRRAATAAAAAGLTACSLLVETGDLVGRERASPTPDLDATTFEADAGSDGDGGVVPNVSCAAAPDMVGAGSFCIDAKEVSQKDYAPFAARAAAATDQPKACAWNSSYAPAGCSLDPASDLPVVGVDWCDAYAYCRSRGKRLCGRIGGGSVGADGRDDPKQDQWYAACSNGGKTTYPYPGEFNEVACVTNKSQPGGLRPVGSSPGCAGGISPDLFDMSGNAGEWEDSCDVAADTGGPDDPCYPRGGDFNNSGPNCACPLVTDSRNRDYSACDVGFRCCADP